MKLNLWPNNGKYAGLYNIDFGIKPGDKVLEIGPGAKPWGKATHLIDLPNANNQRHFQDVKTNGKEFFPGSAIDILPQFPDNYFDFFFCFHVFEHIDDLPKLIDLINLKCKRGFAGFPASDFEFLTAQKHYSHVNLLRVIDGIIHIAKRPQNTIIQQFGKFYEEKMFKDPIFNSLWEGHGPISYRHIWEARIYWQKPLRYKFYPDGKMLFSQLEYFEKNE